MVFASNALMGDLAGFRARRLSRKRNMKEQVSGFEKNIPKKMIAWKFRVLLLTLALVGLSSTQIKASNSNSSEAIYGTNMSQMMVSQTGQFMTNASLQTANNPSFHLETNNKSNITTKSQVNQQRSKKIEFPEVVQSSGKVQTSNNKVTNSPAINSRQKMPQPQSNAATKLDNTKKTNGDNQMAADDINEMQTLVPKSNSSTSLDDSQLDGQKLRPVKMGVSGSSTKFKMSEGEKKEAEVRRNHEQQMRISEESLDLYKKKSPFGRSQGNAREQTESQKELPNFVRSSKGGYMEQRHLAEIEQNSLGGQLEKPNGYSYDPGSTSAYTHTSSLSPSRQEILIAGKTRNGGKEALLQKLAENLNFPQITRQQPFKDGSLYMGQAGGLEEEDYRSIEQIQGNSEGQTVAGRYGEQQINAVLGDVGRRHRYNTVERTDTRARGRGANPCKPHEHSTSFHLGQNNLKLTQEQIAQTAPDFELAKFLRVADGTRLRSNLVFKVIRADSLSDCEEACRRVGSSSTGNIRDTCRSFNYRAYFAAENCELSRHEWRNLKLEDSSQFERDTQFDFYTQDTSRLALGAGPLGAGGLSGLASAQLNTYSALPEPECLEVSQSCTEEGMEFTLRTLEPFTGRIYTYGFHDSCFTDGDGSTTSLLRITKANGFPRCGTQQIGELMTNIVVVQFNDLVQTTRDKKYNLTCYFSGPGEAVVTSNYMEAKLEERSHPIQIEHLPSQNVVTSNVRLRVLYRGQPTNTIALGDLLTLRLEMRPPSGSNLKTRARLEQQESEIFATNVLAKDPYSGKQVQLIDSRGCPVDPTNVFPELQRTPDGALESEFYAFKIPDSNFLIFQATVRTCRRPCEPVICQASNGHNHHPAASSSIKGGGAQQSAGLKAGNGHLRPEVVQEQLSSPSWGRRRRSADFDSEEVDSLMVGESVEHVISARMEPPMGHPDQKPGAMYVSSKKGAEVSDAEEEVKEMLRVFLSRAEMNRLQRADERQLMAINTPKDNNLSPIEAQRYKNDLPVGVIPAEQTDGSGKLGSDLCEAASCWTLAVVSLIALATAGVSLMTAVSMHATRRASFGFPTCRATYFNE